jgi:murein DD-endopeptidase MepM/ murein hydrolase activator NlpD
MPNHGGRVRKFRCTISQAAIIAALLGIGIGAFSLTAIDYARVQLLWAKDQLWLHMVKGERDRLFTSNRELEGHVETLKSLNGSVLAYEQSVKERLDKLSTILRSATTLSVQQDNSNSSKRLASSKIVSEKIITGKIITEKGGAKNTESVVLRHTPKENSENSGIGGPEFDCVYGQDTFGAKNGEEEKTHSDSAGGGCGHLRSGGSEDELISSELFSSEELEALFERSTNPKSPGDLAHALDMYIDLLSSVPLGNPTGGVRTSGFGLRVSPFHRGVKMHEGVDFALKTGSPIRVTGNGEIVKVERHPSYGLYVDVKHHKRVITRYAHMSRSYVKVGQIVERGDLLGAVGSTGSSTGPHLHYEVRVDGRARNPDLFIALARKLEKALL